jgi:hypothetical protein
MNGAPGGYAEALLFAGLFEDLLNRVFCLWGVEEGLTLIATEGDEVELLGLLEAFQALWHGGTSSLHSHPSQKREGWGTRAFMVVGELKGGPPAYPPHPLKHGGGWNVCT